MKTVYLLLFIYEALVPIFDLCIMYVCISAKVNHIGVMSMVLA